MSGWIIWPILITFGAALIWSTRELNRFFDEELQKVGWERIQLVTMMTLVWPITIPYYLLAVKPKLRANRRSDL
jgi:hypothetical protein